MSLRFSFWLPQSARAIVVVADVDLRGGGGWAGIFDVAVVLRNVGPIPPLGAVDAGTPFTT